MQQLIDHIFSPLCLSSDGAVHEDHEEEDVKLTQARPGPARSRYRSSIGYPTGAGAGGVVQCKQTQIKRAKAKLFFIAKQKQAKIIVIYMCLDAINIG